MWYKYLLNIILGGSVLKLIDTARKASPNSNLLILTTISLILYIVFMTYIIAKGGNNHAKQQ